MKRRTTIKDLAAFAGVSVATVSRYINNSGYVDDETGKKIADAQIRLDYKPNRLARGLKTSSSKNIALIVPDIQNPFYSTLSVKTQCLLKECGYTLNVFNTFADSGEEQDSLKSAAMMGVDGIIFAGGHLYDEVREMLLKAECPVILVNGVDTDDFDVALSDEGESTYMATKYLIEQGHNKIAFAGALVNSETGKNRKTGYCRALEEAGIRIDPDYIFEIGNVLDNDAGYKAGCYYSALPQRPTAICCANDLLALGVYHACAQLNISVPDDFSITGVDNILYSELCNPRLTTITNDSSEYARISVQALMERISGGYSGAARKYRIGRNLIIRDSVKKETNAG